MYVEHEADEYFVDKNTFHLPIDGYNKNNGIGDFVRFHKLTLTDELPEKYPNDPHPGFGGHRQIANLLQKELL